MKAGAVIIDLSAEGGGNCEETRPGETAQIGQVTIVAPLNVPSLLGEDASELYSKNQYNLLALMMKDNIIKIDWDDEVLAKTVLTHAGEMKNQAAKPPVDRASGDNSSTQTSGKGGVKPEEIDMQFSIALAASWPFISSCSLPSRAGSSLGTFRRSCTPR